MMFEMGRGTLSGVSVELVGCRPVREIRSSSANNERAFPFADASMIAAAQRELRSP